MKTTTKFNFGIYELSAEQTLETAGLLYHTIREFSTLDVYHDDKLRCHLVGKLKFFLDLYAEMNIRVGTDDGISTHNYYEFFHRLTPDFTEDDESDVLGDYCEYLEGAVEYILLMIKEKGLTDQDDILQYIGSFENLNFQEQMFITDIYYSTQKD